MLTRAPVENVEYSILDADFVFTGLPHSYKIIIRITSKQKLWDANWNCMTATNNYLQGNINFVEGAHYYVH